MDQALQYVRNGGAAEFGANLSHSVRSNPVPVVLIGIGIAWMMLGGQRSRTGYAWPEDGVATSRRGAAYRSGSSFDDERMRDMGASTAGYLDEPYGDDRSYEADRPYDAERSYGSDRSGDTEGGEGRIRRAASAAADVGHRVKDTVTGVAGKAKERLSSVSHGVSSMTHSARMRKNDLMYGSGRQRINQVRDRTMHYIDEQPMVLGAVGVAIGAILGAALPSTRREDALLGNLSDELVEGAKGTAREQLDTVKETVKSSAQRVAETAREEVGKVVDTTTGAGSNSGAGTPSGPSTASTTGTTPPAGGARPSSAPH
jgi:ElaB/YqjD/DUF883 family membrane-anchored ribosome-binding protein